MVRYPSTILGACCVPWDRDFAFDERAFRSSVSLLVRGGLRNLYLFGTAGEGYAVTDSQFQRITEVFVKEMQSHEATPMVGVISLSLPNVIQRIESAVQLGVREFQISLPSWGVLNDRELDNFFRETCGRFRDCNFLHYNLMRSGRLLTAPEYARLAGEHPNLVATKNSTGDIYRIKALLRDAPQLRHFLTEAGFAYGSLLGEPGFLISIASSNPQRAREYFEAGQRRDMEHLLAMQRELLDLQQELIRVVGNRAHMDGAYDKIFSKLLEEEYPLRLLPPYESASQEMFEKYRNVLRQKFPQWLHA